MRFRQYGNAIVIVNIMVLILYMTLLCGAVKSEGLKVLMFGDSLTAGYGLANKDNIPKKLEEKLREEFPNVHITNGGVSGDTSAGGLSRLSWALRTRFDAIIIELGANDGLRGINPKTTYANLDKIINDAKKLDLKVLLTGMKAPPNLGLEYAAEFNGIFPALAKKYNVLFFPFFLEGVAANPKLNQEDGIHPNQKGVDVIVKQILPIVSKLLNDIH